MPGCGIRLCTRQIFLEFLQLERDTDKAAGAEDMMNVPTACYRQGATARQIVEQINRIEERNRSPGAIRRLQEAARHPVVDEKSVSRANIGQQLLKDAYFDAALAFRQLRSRQDLYPASRDAVAQKQADAR